MTTAAAKVDNTQLTTYYCVGAEEYVRFEEHFVSALSHLAAPSPSPTDAGASVSPHTLSLSVRVSPTPPYEYEFPTLKRINGSRYVATGKFFSWKSLYDLNKGSIRPPPTMPHEKKQWHDNVGLSVGVPNFDSEAQMLDDGTPSAKLNGLKKRGKRKGDGRKPKLLQAPTSNVPSLLSRISDGPSPLAFDSSNNSTETDNDLRDSTPADGTLATVTSSLSRLLVNSANGPDPVSPNVLAVNGDKNDPWDALTKNRKGLSSSKWATEPSDPARSTPQPKTPTSASGATSVIHAPPPTTPSPTKQTNVKSGAETPPTLASRAARLSPKSQLPSKPSATLSLSPTPVTSRPASPMLKANAISNTTGGNAKNAPPTTKSSVSLEGFEPNGSPALSRVQGLLDRMAVLQRSQGKREKERDQKRQQQRRSDRTDVTSTATVFSAEAQQGQLGMKANSRPVSRDSSPNRLTPARPLARLSVASTTRPIRDVAPHLAVEHDQTKPVSLSPNNCVPVEGMSEREGGGKRERRRRSSGQREWSRRRSRGDVELPVSTGVERRSSSATRSSDQPDITNSTKEEESLLAVPFTAATTTTLSEISPLSISENQDADGQDIIITLASPAQTSAPPAITNVLLSTNTAPTQSDHDNNTVESSAPAVKELNRVFPLSAPPGQLAHQHDTFSPMKLDWASMNDDDESLPDLDDWDIPPTTRDSYDYADDHQSEQQQPLSALSSSFPNVSNTTSDSLPKHSRRQINSGRRNGRRSGLSSPLLSEPTVPHRQNLSPMSSCTTNTSTPNSRLRVSRRNGASDFNGPSANLFGKLARGALGVVGNNNVGLKKSQT